MKKNDINSLAVTRFSNLHCTKPQNTTWENICMEIKGNTHVASTRIYRAALQQQEEATACESKKNVQMMKIQRGRLKSMQPAFLCSALVEGGRTTKHIRAYTGYYMADFDEVDPAYMPKALEQIRADEHTFMAYVTLSGRGIRVVARATTATCEQEFEHHWKAVNAYYAQLTGLTFDPQCKNPTRLSVICHDAACHFCPTATVLDTPPPSAATPETERRGIGRPRSMQRVAAVIRRLVEQDGTAYAPGQHNAYASRCLYWANRFGIAQTDALQWATTTFADYEASHPGTVAAIVKSCYALTAEHASCNPADYSSGRNGTRAGNKATLKQQEQFITERYQLRNNKLSHITEFREIHSEGPWMRMDDAFENSLWCAMERQGIHTDINALRMLLTSDFVPDFFPVKAYLDGLPAWDGHTDHIGQMWARVHCKDTDPETFDYYARRWFVGMLASAMDTRVVNHQILVLLGRQGCFKSSFMENLLPPELRPYYTSKTNATRLNKDDHFALTENLIINFEEIDTMTRPELNRLKALTTMTYIHERPAYGRNKVRLPHVASFCATGNNLQFLTDDTGNRRWMPFEVDHIDNPWTHPLPYADIYAQGKALLENGFCYWLTDSDIERLHRHNRHYESPNPAREFILSHYRKPAPGELPLYLTSTRILSMIPGHLRVTAIQVGKAMKDLGFESKRTNVTRFWEVAERSGFDITHTLPKEPENAV